MTMRTPAAAAAATIAMVILSGSPLSADFIRLSRAAGLKESPSSDAADKVKLAKSTELNLVEDGQTNGYYHVVDDASGLDGFIFRTMGRRFPGGANGGTALTGAGDTGGGTDTGMSAGRAARVASGKKKKAQPCFATLASCPVTGCADPQDDPGHALLNTRKHNTSPSGTLTPLSFSQMKQLQSKTNALHLPVGPGTELSTEDRAKLANFSLPGGVTASEGQFIQLVGFISPDRKLTASSGESVNCKLTDASSNDIHIPIVAASDDTEFDSIVVETIPQGRPSAWSVAGFKKLQNDGTLLMIRGQLLYDNQHLVNDDEESGSTQPKRFTIWEIHPVTELFQCTRTQNDCDPGNASQWKRLQ
jgi:hypothetical protein